MFWFREKDADFYSVTPERRREALARGTLFSDEELREIMRLWAELFASPPLHNATLFAADLKAGGRIEISPDCVAIDSPSLTPVTIKAVMQHAKKHWGGKLVYELNPDSDPATRRMVHAFAQLYGIELTDQNEFFLPLALGREDLAKLPEIRREIRAANSDAPPERPNEAAQLAAAHARRFPLLVPKIAA